MGLPSLLLCWFEFLNILQRVTIPDNFSWRLLHAQKYPEISVLQKAIYTRFFHMWEVILIVFKVFKPTTKGVMVLCLNKEICYTKQKNVK